MAQPLMFMMMTTLQVQSSPGLINLQLASSVLPCETFETKKKLLKLPLLNVTF
jgi:hypothetical protein